MRLTVVFIAIRCLARKHLRFHIITLHSLYVGILSYNPEQTRQAATILKNLGTPCIIHQPRYNMFDRWIEDGLLDVLSEESIGCIGFSPLCQGILTDKYLEDVPEDSRAGKWKDQLTWGDAVSKERIAKVAKLNGLLDEFSFLNAFVVFRIVLF